jgi:hypothetical protein
MTAAAAPPAAQPRCRADVVVVILFLAAIATPALGLMLDVDPATVSEAEMRELSKLPAWSWQPSALLAWPGKFQQYFEDHFTLRSRLIYWRAAFLWHVLHTSASTTVIAGTHGWLFYADDGGMDDYVQAQPFTGAELATWRQTLERERDWLADRGAHFVFVIAPDKNMIYPEFMPGSLQRMRAASREDQLLAYMKLHSTVDILDLRPGILSLKTSELLYHRYDTHWNDRGALIGYQEIVARLSRWFPQMQPLQRSDFLQNATIPSGDRTTLLGLTDGGKPALPGLMPRRGWSAITVEPKEPDPYGEDGTVVTELRGSHLPRAVMFRDSFSSRLIPYLSEHFRRILYQWQNDFDPQLVEREQPDVVIHEMVGRHLYIFIPSPELVPPVTHDRPVHASAPH